MRNFEDLKIAVAGTGYVGLSMATLLSPDGAVIAKLLYSYPRSPFRLLLFLNLQIFSFV